MFILYQKMPDEATEYPHSLYHTKEAAQVSAKLLDPRVNGFWRLAADPLNPRKNWWQMSTDEDNSPEYGYSWAGWAIREKREGDQI